jgi:hypothetical protein
MNTEELNCILSKHLPSEVFIGTFDASSFQVRSKVPYCFVINLEPKCLPGSHWCSIYVNENREPYYFDPLGQYPHYAEWVHYLSASSSNGFWDYNKIQVQPISSTNCGQFNIYYLINRYKDKIKSNYNIIKNANDETVIAFFDSLKNK